MAMAADLLVKKLVKYPALFQAPKGEEPPPFLIRALLVLTCTGVSFFHGSNDGQKGMGLIMLILIGTVPTAYALNHAVGHARCGRFRRRLEQVSGILTNHVDRMRSWAIPVPMSPSSSRPRTSRRPPWLPCASW
jgi:PiT family inorganic phosphate transporter